MPLIPVLTTASLFLAPIIWLGALTGALAGREPFASCLYLFAWWPAIFFLDAWLYRRTGKSWIYHRPREFLRLCQWSVTAWLVFEAANLVLGNWRYVGLIPIWWLRWPGYALSFATVLPGILLTAKVLETLGAWRRASGPARSLKHWQLWSLLAGTGALFFSLAVPQWGFPLIWLALIFLLDPLCQVLGGDSLMESFAQGERREHLCLLTAGLICGLWWEVWNYPSGARWVYTLPIFNYPKLFEMPLLGYLGFLPFALEAAVIYNFLTIIQDRFINTPGRRLGAALLQAAFWITMFTALDAWTVVWR